MREFGGCGERENGGREVVRDDVCGFGKVGEEDLGDVGVDGGEAYAYDSATCAEFQDVERFLLQYFCKYWELWYCPRSFWI